MPTVQAELQSFPQFLTQALDALGDPQARHRPRADAWSLAEVLWHLAEMEREYFGPALARRSCEGLALPAAREGRSLDPYLALERFQHARRENLSQEAVELVWRQMAEHDARHRVQITALITPSRP